MAKYILVLLVGVGLVVIPAVVGTAQEEPEVRPRDPFLSLGVATRLHFISILGQTATLSSSHGLFRFEPIGNLGLRFGLGTMSLQGLKEIFEEIPIPLSSLLITDLSVLYLIYPFYVGAGLGLISAQGIGITTFQGFIGLELKLVGPLNLFGEAQLLVASAMGIGTTVPSIGFGVSFSF